MDFDKYNRGADFLKKRAEVYKQKKEETPNGGRDYIFKTKVAMFSPKDGENQIRCLPGTWPDAYLPWLEVWIHYQIGANNSQFLCPAKMLKKPCPICDEHKKLLESGKTPEEINSLQAQLRAICWLIDRAEEAKGPQIWVMPYTKIAKEIINHAFNRRTGEPVFVDDPQNGWNIFFKKAGKLKNTQYSGVSKDDESSPLHNDEEVMAKWLNFVSENVIPDMLQYKDYNYIKEALHGLTPEDAKPAVAITSAQSKTKEVKAEAKTVTVTKTSTLPVGDGVSIATLSNMDRTAMEELIDSKKLTTDPKEWEDDDSLRDAISLELELTN